MSESTKKKSSLLTVLLIIFLIIVIIAGGLFFIYKTKIDISNQYNDKFNYTCDQSYDSSELAKLNKTTYIASDNVLRIDFSKTLVLQEIIDLNELNDELSTKYNVQINSIGYDVVDDDSIAIYADVTYNNMIDALVQATIRYQTNDNDINLYLESLQIGNLPASIIESFINIDKNQPIYTVDSNEMIAKMVPNLEDSDIDIIDESLIDLTYFTNLHSDSDTVGIDFDVYNYVKMLLNDKLGSLADLFVPTVLNELESRYSE